MKLKLNWKNLFISFLIVLGIIAVFTLIDYLFHMLSEEYAVPGYYYRNKMIFGTMISFIAYIFTAKAKPIAHAFIFSAVVSILLQLRYYIEGYPRDFVFLFLGIHFGILAAITIPVFIMLKNKSKSSGGIKHHD